MERRSVSAAIRLPPEELKEMFEQISKHKLEGKGRGKGWQFSLPPDEEFSKRYVLLIRVGFSCPLGTKVQQV